MQTQAETLTVQQQGQNTRSKRRQIKNFRPIMICIKEFISVPLLSSSGKGVVPRGVKEIL